MNNALLGAVLVLSALAQLLPGIQAPGVPPSGAAPMPNIAGGGAPGAQQQPELKVRVLALQALNTGEKKIDPKLKGAQKLLKELPYDTFRFVNDVQEEATAMIETRLPINALFTFYATLLGQNEEGGVNVASRIEMLDDGKLVNALRTEGVLEPGKWLVFRGLPLSSGEMVVLMTLVQEQSDEQSQSQNDEESEDQQKQESENKDEQNSESKQQNEGEENKDEQKPEDQEKQEGEAEQQQDKPEEQKEGEQAEGEESAQQQDAQSGDEQEAKKMEKPEIEALLDSLEEIDRREQKTQRENKGRPFFPSSGEWW